MQFNKTLPQVLSGLKTQTRRLVQPGDTTELDSLNEIWRVYRNGRLLYQVGKSYAAQGGRGQPAAGRILLKSIRKERVNEISEGDALAEGCIPSLENGWKLPIRLFPELWDSIHKGPHSFYSGAEVWALEFSLIEEDKL